MGGVAALLPSLPQVQFEYDWGCTAPTKDDDCSGVLWIAAWLHVTQRVPVDPYLTWNLDRLLLPQRYEVHWKLDTVRLNEIEYCPQWQIDYKGANNLDAAGNYFNPVIFQQKPPDDPDDSGSALRATCGFRWFSSSSPVTLTSSPATVTVSFLPDPQIPALAAQSGVSSAKYELAVDWLLDIQPVEAWSEDPEYQLTTNGTLAEPLYCRVHAHGGVRRQGGYGRLMQNSQAKAVKDTKTRHKP